MSSLRAAVGSAAALTPLGAVRYTPDIAVNLSGTVVNHNQVAQDNLAGAISLANIGAIPYRSNSPPWLFPQPPHSQRAPNKPRMCCLKT